jgi:hypothetical protein
LRRRSAGTGAYQDRHLAAGVQDFGCLCEIGLFGHNLWLAVTHARTSEPMRNSRLFVILILDILWQDQHGGTI